MRRPGQRAVSRVVFDDPNLISTAGLVPAMTLAQKAHLAELADSHTTIPTDKGANAGAKVLSLVAGMVAGADSIDDMALLRHGAMSKVLERPYAPSTLGSFLRSFTFGHVRQLDAVASRFLTGLTTHTQVLEGVDDRILVDIDDTIIEVHGHGKQGAGFGYTGTRGLNALIAIITTAQAAPVIAAQRLRKGSCGSPRGAARIVADTLATVRRLRDPKRPSFGRRWSATTSTCATGSRPRLSFVADLGALDLANCPVPFAEFNRQTAGRAESGHLPMAGGRQPMRRPVRRARLRSIDAPRAAPLAGRAILLQFKGDSCQVRS